MKPDKKVRILASRKAACLSGSLTKKNNQKFSNLNHKLVADYEKSCCFFQKNLQFWARFWRYSSRLGEKGSWWSQIAGVSNMFSWNFWKLWAQPKIEIQQTNNWHFSCITKDFLEVSRFQKTSSCEKRNSMKLKFEKNLKKTAPRNKDNQTNKTSS